MPNFYGEGNNFEWDGCSCHGQWIRCENGEKAGKCINLLESLKPRCDKCNSLLGEDGLCTEDWCDNFYEKVL